MITGVNSAAQDSNLILAQGGRLGVRQVMSEAVYCVVDTTPKCLII